MLLWIGIRGAIGIPPLGWSIRSWLCRSTNNGFKVYNNQSGNCVADFAIAKRTGTRTGARIAHSWRVTVQTNWSTIQAQLLGPSPRSHSRVLRKCCASSVTDSVGLAIERYSSLSAFLCGTVRKSWFPPEIVARASWNIGAAKDVGRNMRKTANF